MTEFLLDLLRALCGVLVFLGIAYVFSAHRKQVNWRTVIFGLILQVVLALLLLKVPMVNKGFQYVAAVFVKLLSFTREGSQFLFGDLITNTESFGFIFAFQVLPTVLFFSALTALLFYLGILQKVVQAFAYVMTKTMGLSGAESLSVSANVFVGQTEAPLLVKPYLASMSKSEIMCLMTGGMATVAGGVLAAYVSFLGGDDPVQQQMYATHLLTASIMNAPASIIIAKLLFPETNKDINKSLKIDGAKNGSNVLDAISLGVIDGLKLAVNVGAMLLVFIALIAFINFLISKGIGSWTGLNDAIAKGTDGTYDKLSLEYMLAMIFAPISWLMGVPTEDLTQVGQLLGEKTIINEFYAYVSLGEMKAEGTLNYKSIIIATYALCGFANFSSIGIQIGGISSLAPSQRSTLASLGFRALLGGTLACLLTATWAGLIAV